MAQKIIYICDNCKKELGDNEHLSLNFSSNSGWVVKNNNRGWIYTATIPPIIYQFCNLNCFMKYLRKIRRAYKIKKLKE